MSKPTVSTLYIYRSGSQDFVYLSEYRALQARVAELEAAATAVLGDEPHALQGLWDALKTLWDTQKGTT